MSQRIASEIQDSIQCSWCRAFNRAHDKTCASCGAPLQTNTAQNRVSFARALPSGTRLRGGDYEIQDVIGQGNFGITYRALNHRLNRVVAIKEWFPATCERNALQVLAGPNLNADEFNKSKAAFLDEARVLARFDHTALVSVFAAWEENASAYMEMELLHGPTLAQVLKRFHHLKTEDALRLFAPLLEALQQLHEEHWLHRDLNPHNIVLCNAAFEAKDAATCVQNARAVLIDFGAARQITPDTSQDFSVLVTPGYTPLEQYARRARRGAYSDIYALCATLYHALSGQIPPPAADRATGSALVPLRELAPAVPEPLCRAIESGLEIEIARRPQTVRALRELLPMLSVPVPVKNAPQVLAAPVVPVKSAPQVLAAPMKWPQVADDALATTNAASRARAGNSLWWLWLVVGPILLVGVLRPRPRVEPNWSAPATRLIEEPPLRFEAPPSFVEGRVGRSSSGNWHMQSSEQSVSAVNSVTGKSWQWTIEKEAMAGTPIFAPDDSWMMVFGMYSNGENSGGRVWFYDLETGKTINVWSGKAEDDAGAGFLPFISPRGRYVGIKRFPHVLRIWEVRTHRDFAFRWPASTARMGPAPSSKPWKTSNQFDWQSSEFSPDETQILLGGRSRNLWLIDLSTRTVHQAQLPLVASEKAALALPDLVSAHFSSDNQFVDWVASNTGQKGRLPLSAFNQKIPVEIIDGATSRPE